MTSAIFANVPDARRHEIISVVGHYIAGVIDWKSASAIVEGISAPSVFLPGMRVRTIRGSAHGAVVRVHDNDRVTWLPDGGSLELTGSADSLLPES